MQVVKVITENGAAGPPRPWGTTPDDLLQGGGLIRRLEAPGRELIVWLADHEDQRLEREQLARRSGVSTEDVATVIRRVQQICDAFGKVPLISVEEDLCFVTASHARTIHAVIAELDSRR